MAESNFTHNNAIRGGAIYLLTRNNLTTSYSNFIHNLAESDGGAIYSENQNKLYITGDNCFTGNQARSGGVVCVRESTVIIHSHILITNNTDTEAGGAVYQQLILLSSVVTTS